MRVGSELAFDLDAARLELIACKAFRFHRRDFAGEESALLRRERTRKAARGEFVDLRPRDLVLPRQILRGVAHAGVGCGIEQRFPEKILELDLAHAEAAAMRVGGDRIAAHRFGTDAQRKFGAAERNRIGRLAQDLDAGAADALHHMRRCLDRHAGIEADMARQHVGVEARLRHGAGDDGADILRRDASLARARRAPP